MRRRTIEKGIFRVLRRRWIPLAIYLLSTIIVISFLKSIHQGDFCVAARKARLAGDGAACWEYWLNRYQTFLAGIVALGAAVVAWKGVKIQLNSAEEAKIASRIVKVRNLHQQGQLLKSCLDIMLDPAIQTAVRNDALEATLMGSLHVVDVNLKLFDDEWARGEPPIPLELHGRALRFSTEAHATREQAGAALSEIDFQRSIPDTVRNEVAQRISALRAPVDSNFGPFDSECLDYMFRLEFRLSQVQRNSLFHDPDITLDGRDRTKL